MLRNAWFSPCKKYRYALSRIWEPSKPYVLFIGLNPSTADAIKDDPTIRRCQRYAADWGYGGLYVANLFAYRATKPEVLKAASEPVGHDNNRWLTKLAKGAGIVIAAWGNDGQFKNRAEQVLRELPQLHCLKINRSGQPAHPLYQNASAKPVLFKSAEK